MLNLFVRIRTFFPVIVILMTGSLQAQSTVSPLSSYSSEWNHPDYQECNTAAEAAYMTQKEKDVIYILNLVRSYPEQFAETVLENYPERSGNPHLRNDAQYYQSLLKKLRSMEPVSLLDPDDQCFTSARCHAVHSGQRGYIGHNRQSAECKKKKYYTGECCDYGNSTALDIVLSLLIDQGVPSLGHRMICLDNRYDVIGVSIQPHRKYGTNTVLDFH